tara:strand:+ start:110 stop:271 length:162 start_codon:yes stop_codon:yes gene_type:complete
MEIKNIIIHTFKDLLPIIPKNNSTQIGGIDRMKYPMKFAKDPKPNITNILNFN